MTKRRDLEIYLLQTGQRAQEVTDAIETARTKLTWQQHELDATAALKPAVLEILYRSGALVSGVGAPVTPQAIAELVKMKDALLALHAYTAAALETMPEDDPDEGDSDPPTAIT